MTYILQTLSYIFMNVDVFYNVRLAYYIFNMFFSIDMIVQDETEY